MRKKLLTLTLLLLAGLTSAHAYDFSAVAPSGQTLYYNINNSTATVTLTPPNSYTPYGYSNYTAPSGALTIPSSVTNGGNTYTVTAIGEYALYHCVDLTSVSFPNTITSIGQYALNGCTSLTAISVPNAVTSIGYYAFSGCTSLSSANLSNGLTSIGLNAFSGCTSLLSITIPSTVTSIGNYAFSSCGLTTINFNATNCTSCGGYYNPAFNNCIYVTSINIGSNVIRIPNSAFIGCSNITSITIPDSVAYIEDNAFSNCTGLTTINFNATNCISIGSSCWSGCSNVTTINIGNNVTRIPNSAFNGRSLVSSVTIPAPVTFVGNYAFQNCTSLTTVNYYADSCITMDGSYVFNGCPNLQNLNIGSNVHYIPANAFYNCRALTSVVIPDSVTTIGASAFYGCQGLTSVTIGKRVNSILSNAFSNCTTLFSTHYTGTLTQWCGIDFYNSASNPVAQSGNLYINNQPITNLVIPDSVTTIRNYSFYGCSGLSSVTIPNTVSSIQNYSFEYCDYLISLSLGSALTSIGSNAFRHCSALSSITSFATIAPSLGSNAFYGSSLSSISKYIPCGSLASYRSRWGNYSNYYEMAGPSFAVYTSDSTMGSVTVLVQPSCTTQTATFVAAPNLGYRFDHWSDGDTTNPRSLTVSQDTMLAAFFLQDLIPTDTVYLHDTITVYSYLHDTTYINNYIHDTISVINYIHDTVTVTTVIHDTTVVNNYIYDTITVTDYIHDTVTVTVTAPIDYYNLSLMSAQPSLGIVVGSGRYSDSTVVEIAAIPVCGNHFAQWSDGNTENPRHVLVRDDKGLTASFAVDEVGITNVEATGAIVTVQDNTITVLGAKGERVRIFDAVGRLLSTNQDIAETQHFRMATAGVYLVQIGNGAAQRVVIR